MDATLNVRMSASLKERGDEVLRENGISASEAVRALWQEMATTRVLPSFLRDAVDETEKKVAKTRALNGLVGVAAGSLTNMTDVELEAIGEDRYE